MLRAASVKIEARITTCISILSLLLYVFICHTNVTHTRAAYLTFNMILCTIICTIRKCLSLSLSLSLSLIQPCIFLYPDGTTDSQRSEFLFVYVYFLPHDVLEYCRLLETGYDIMRFRTSCAAFHSHYAWYASYIKSAIRLKECRRVCTKLYGTIRHKQTIMKCVKNI